MISTLDERNRIRVNNMYAFFINYPPLNPPTLPHSAGMKLVVNFDLPFEYNGGNSSAPKVPDYATFQHRCGRVGRFGQIGAVINLVSNGGDDEGLGQLARHFALPMRELPAHAPEEASILVEEAMSKPPGPAGQ